MFDQFEKEKVPDGEDLLAKARRRLVHIEVKNGESSNVYEWFLNSVYLWSRNNRKKDIFNKSK